MMIREKSIVTVSGFKDSYVPIDLALRKHSGAGVTLVSKLPSVGEEGKIYYNTTLKKYYVYTRTNGFTELPIGLSESIECHDINSNRIANLPGTGTEYDGKSVYMPSDSSDDSSLELEKTYYDETLNRCFKLKYDPEFTDVIRKLHPEYSDKIYLIEFTNPTTDDIFYIKKYHTWWKFEEYQVPEDLSYPFDPQTTALRKCHLYTAVTLWPRQFCVLPSLSGNTYVANVIADPSKFYDCGEINILMVSPTGWPEIPYEDILPLVPVTGRFVAAESNINIVLPTSISAAQSNPAIIQNHFYEFSILDGVFNLTDISPIEQADPGMINTQ